MAFVVDNRQYNLMFDDAANCLLSIACYPSSSLNFSRL